MKKFMLLCAAVLFSVAGLDAQQRPGNGYGHEGRPQQEGQMRQGAPQGGARGGKGMKGRGRRPAPKVDEEFLRRFEEGEYRTSELSIKFRRQTILPDAGTPRALVLFLHGKSAGGTDNLRQLTLKGLRQVSDYLMERGQNAVLVAPQCPDEYLWADYEMTAALKGWIKKMIKKEGIDKSRVYVLGVSAGGAGVWKLIESAPKLLTAAMPVTAVPEYVSKKKHAALPVFFVSEDPDAPMQRPGQGGRGGRSGQAMGQGAPQGGHGQMGQGGRGMEQRKALLRERYRELEAVGGKLRVEMEKGKNHYVTGSTAFTDERLDWLFSQQK